MQKTTQKPKNLISGLGPDVAKANLTMIFAAVMVLMIILIFYYWSIAIIGILILLALYLYFRMFYIPMFFRCAECILAGRFIILKKGVFYQKKTVIPISHVQYCVIRQDVVQKVFGVCTVRIMMAGSSQRLRPVSKEDAGMIRDAVNTRLQKRGSADNEQK